MIGWKTRINRRHARAHPWLVGLSVLGIAVGVAVFVSIRLANVSARRAFELSTQAVAGNATHRLLGGPSGLDEREYARLRVEGHLGRAAPVVEDDVQPLRAPERRLRLLGVDIFAEGPFRSWTPDAEVDAGAFVVEPGSAMISALLAQEWQLRTGDELVVRVGGQDQRLRVAGTFSAADVRTQRATANLVLTDIATAQQLLGRTGRIDYVDLILDETQARDLQAALPETMTLEDASAQAESLGELTRAFELNLTALGLLALVVGMFLIYNTMTFAIVQRRQALGTLRALGVTRGELFSLVLGDAIRIAVPGTIAGVAGGFLLARVLVRLVAQTTNDLYFAVEVRQVETDPGTLLLGALLGVMATLLSALHPAIEAARAAPVTVLRRSSQEDRTRAALPLLTVLGIIGSLAGAALLRWPSNSVPLAFVGLFGVLLGLALTVPAWTWFLSRAARRPLGAALGSVGRMAAGSVANTLSRTSVAVAALTVSVATALSVGIMVQSFRRTVVTWLDASLLADVYVTAPGSVGRRGAEALPAEASAQIAKVDGVAGIFTVRTRRVRTAAGPADLIAASFGGLPQRPYQVAEGDADEVWTRFARGEGVLVSEPYAFKRDVGPGDEVTVFTDRGARRFEVLAVFYDYVSSAGSVLLPRAEYDRFFDDRAISGIAVFAAPGHETQLLAERVRSALGPIPSRIQETRTLKDASLAVFDRTFTITQVLRVLALGVSFIGVFAALLALQLERTRELALLRAIGLLPREVWKLVAVQTALMGLISGALAVPLGYALAAALVHVINRRSFGWTLELQVEPWTLLQGVLLALVAAVLAGIYPAMKMSRTSPALALREGT